jgi:hypothetical protein
MIEAVMYGMMPSAKTESERSAPPEKRLSSVRTPVPESELLTASMQFFTLV